MAKDDDPRRKSLGVFVGGSIAEAAITRPPNQICNTHAAATLDSRKLGIVSP